jgi:bleomycin hydrolase
MRKIFPVTLVTVAVSFVFATMAAAQTDSVLYVPRVVDSTLEKIEKDSDSLKARRDSVTSSIRKAQKDLKEAQRKARKEFRFDVSGIHAPDSPGVFATVFHFPPVAQWRTGTCWSFSATSYIESEVARQTGRKIKLSEMHTVYYEYLAKARHFVQTRGETWNGEGSEANALIRVMKEHGAVPESVYTGLVPGEAHHDHAALSAEVAAYLDYVKAHDYWDEDAVVDHVRLILNAHIGAPPTEFKFAGKTYTPMTFLANVMKINLNDYVDVISTLSFPYYTQGPYEVPDNWWYDSTYYNLPLDKWYGAIVSGIQKGYSIELGGDVSEPGWYGQKDLAVVPDYDIPSSYITPASREFRFHNQTSTDDHGIHVVGYKAIDGRDWFLIKDSGSGGRRGQFWGYFFMRDDYMRLKMLCYTVHKDVLRDLLDKFPKVTASRE